MKPLLFLLFCTIPLSLLAADWRPIDPAESAQKTARLDPAADAEILLWDVKVEDRLQGGDLSLQLNHYVRIKIFTSRGKEEQATVEIPRLGRRTINDVAGRTIKPNGTIVELKKDSIFDRELLKAKYFKLRGKTFVLPNVEPGDIIEYQYRETRQNEIAQYLRLYFQRDIPIWNVTYHIKPLDTAWSPYAMRTMAFQLTALDFKKENNGFYAISRSDMPAFKTESYMPPEDQLQAWMLIYYEEDKKLDPAKYWKELGKKDYNDFKPLLKADGQVKKTAEEVTSGAADPAAKIAALDTFVRTKIKNANSRAFHLTAEERKTFKENHSPGDTLKQRVGTSLDVDFLFAAMAGALGFDARMARVPDRGDTFFNREQPTTYFLNEFSVAVKVGDKWSFYDPSTSYLEPGMLRWQEEGQQALLSDPKEGTFIPTPYTDPARSKRQRRAHLKLLPNGTVEGTVEYTYTGHVARDRRLQWEEVAPADQEKEWKEAETNRISTAEIGDVSIAGIGDSNGPIVIKHGISVPGYATRTGRRILLQPAFFQFNQGQRFAENTRQWSLYFNYGWSEDDEVTIELPEGWQLDQAQAPVSTKLGEVGEYTTEARISNDQHTLVYRRRFDWGRGQQILFPASSYSQVRNAFDAVRNNDNYTLSLKEGQ
ncbi:MAG TPA: DUF3857 domain-containing protein [Bryobacteraceae bacterium]|nr:DUF3857 domain-containing protein [Bryobacteraceae bacterium]